MINFFHFKKPLALIAVLWTLFLAAVLLLWLHGNEVYWRLPVPVQAAQPSGHGPYSYIVPMVTDWLSQTDTFDSPALLLEDGRTLGPANALHNRIGKNGAGRFSFWKGSLYFSSSDNSDPRINGRKYILALPFQKQVAYFGYLIFVLLILSTLYSTFQKRWNQLFDDMRLTLRQLFDGARRIGQKFVDLRWDQLFDDTRRTLRQLFDGVRGIGHKFVDLLKDRNQVFALIAVVFFLMVSIPIMYYGRGERSSWVLLTTSFPGGAPAWGLFGYNFAIGDVPLMSENYLYVDQSLMYSGSMGHLSLYFSAVRGMYGFLVSLFSPLVGILPAFWLLNLLGWGLAAYCTWRLTLGISKSRLAAFLSVVLVTGGLGFVLHSNDYSPHLIPFVMYYVGLLIIYQSRVWLETRPLRSHLILGAYLALACLSYNNGLYLVGGYILVSILRNRWWHIGLASLIALSAQYIWIFILNLLQAYVVGSWAWTNVSGFEQQQLWRSLSIWMALPFSQFVPIFFKGILQFLLFEFPLVTLLGFAAWFVLPWTRSQRWFFFVFFWLPFAGGLAYLHTSTTRGYLVYGSSMLIYVPLAIWMARWLEARRSFLRKTGLLGVLLIVGIQLFWSTAFLWGYVVPTKIFFGFGYLEWIPKYLTMFHLPPVFSLTGAEPTPVMFGGKASLEQAGLYVESKIPDITFSFPFALAARSLISFYFGLFVALAASTKKNKRLGLTAVILGLWFIPALLPQFSPPKPLPLFSTFYTIYIPADQQWVYSVTLSDEFIERLKQYDSHDVKIQFMFPGIHYPFQTRIVGSGNTVLGEIDDGAAVINATVSLDELIAVLGHSKKIEVNIKTRPAGVNVNDGTAIFGWQRNGLPGREFYNLVSGKPWEGYSLPAFELRILDSSDRPLLIGY